MRQFSLFFFESESLNISQKRIWPVKTLANKFGIMLIRVIYFWVWNIPRPENYFLKDFSFGQNLFGVKISLKDFSLLKDYPLKDFEDPYIPDQI